jgi:transglutaminase-like putative cysteine protease
MSMKNVTRRDAIKLFGFVGTSAVTVAAMSGCSGSNAGKEGSSNESAAPASSASQGQAAAKADVKTTAGTVTANVDLTQYEAGKVVRLWLNVPQDYEYQKVGDVKFDAPGAETAQVNTDDDGNQMLYAEWGADADPSTRTCSLSFHVNREECVRPELVESGDVPDDIKPYLEGSTLVPVNQQVVDAANQIVGDKNTVFDKAKAIYDWIVANMNRDESVQGCGQGDVCALLSTRSGKCTDINSVFVGLCRAVDIPARELFGVRMNADDVTTAQHCWAEFYLPGTGWVSADPADVLKAVLKNNWSKDQQETKDKADYYWGGLDSERVQLSFGREVTLSPAQDGPALNYFGYPYAEVGGDALDYYDPKNFVYTISFAKD